MESAVVRTALAGLSEATRERIRARARALAAAAETPRDGACVMLEDDGGCAIYASRPMVCRTQGHALLYPKGTIPEGGIYGTTKSGEITWCPLNYTDGKPKSEDVLQAGLIDAGLAQINRRIDAERALERVSMIDLALG